MSYWDDAYWFEVECFEYCDEYSAHYSNPQTGENPIYQRNIEEAGRWRLTDVPGEFCPKCPMKHRCPDGIIQITELRNIAQEMRFEMQCDIEHKLCDYYRSREEMYGVDIECGYFYNTPEHHAWVREEWLKVEAMLNDPYYYAQSDYLYDCYREQGRY